MKTKLPTLKKISILFLFSIMMLGNKAGFATSFTAVTSGPWSSAVTWGGTAPDFILMVSQITIPVGVVVIMDNDVTLDGPTVELVVHGTLSTSTSNTVTVTEGLIGGTGTIMVDNVIIGANVVFDFTGILNTNTFVSYADSLQTAASFMVNQTFTLPGGVVNFVSGGSLNLAANATIVISGGQLTVNGGTLNLSSYYNVTYSTVTAVAGPELSGSGIQNVYIDLGVANSVTLADHLIVNGTLSLNSGTLVLGGYNLTIAGNYTANGSAAISSTNASSINLTSTFGASGTLMFNGPSNAVNNLSVNVGLGNNIGITGTLEVTGALTLTSGRLVLDSTDLILSGYSISSGNGTLSSDARSNIFVSTAVSPNGSLAFTPGINTINNFSVDIADGGSVGVSSDLIINGSLDLITGHVSISTHTIYLGNAGSITGAGSDAYVITDANGLISFPLTAGDTVPTVYPVGTVSLYLPASILLNTGSTSGNVSVGVTPNVYSNGASGNDISDTTQLIDASWHLQAANPNGLDLNLELMWPANAEVNLFNRSSAYITHHTNAGWDSYNLGAASAMSGGMYSLSRNNIDTLSTFTIFDESSYFPVSANEINNQSEINIYPNPANSVIMITNINSSTAAVNMDLVNIYGQVIMSKKLTDVNNTISINELPDGNYFIKLYNDKMNKVEQFTKVR